MSRKLYSILSSLLVLGALMPGLAHAIIVQDNKIMTTGNENVVVTFVSSSAADTDLLFEAAPNSELLFNNHTSAPGSSVNLGSFLANSEILFRLDDTASQYSFYSGPASRNPDDQTHVKITDLGQGVWQLGWEDTFNKGDADYNDLIVTVAGVAKQDPVPEPATLALVGLGLAGAAYARRRRVKA